MSRKYPAPVAGQRIADEAWARYSATWAAYLRGEARLGDARRDREAFDRTQAAIETAAGDDTRRYRLRGS